VTLARIFSHFQITLIRLPPNATHILQPLDVGFFSPLKLAWSAILKHWYRQTRLRILDKAAFPTQLALLWNDIDSANVACGFRGSGLFPLNVEKPLSKTIASRASESYEPEESTFKGDSTAAISTGDSCHREREETKGKGAC
jgi:hypothetical protein